MSPPPQIIKSQECSNEFYVARFLSCLVLLSFLFLSSQLDFAEDGCFLFYILFSFWFEARSND